MYVKVHAIPGRRKELVTKVDEVTFEIQVKEKAERNLANRRIQTILGELFQVPSTQVRLLTGHRTSSKMYSIDVSL
jgi:uncharacterized protein YggU (UPF0235/DUF167 family)